MRRALLVLGLVMLGGCFKPERPTCSYICSESEPRCPDEYECREDNYCHLKGSTAACGFGDASAAVDQSVPRDMAQPRDLAESD
jgi:hypothetical protein